MFDGLHTVAQGKLGLVYAITALAERGYSISVPLIDDQPYDLVADDGTRLLKVQVKSTQYKPNGKDYVVQLKHVHHNKTENILRYFDNTLVDLVVIVCDNKDTFIIPSLEITARTGMTLGEKYTKYKHRIMEG